MHLIYKQFKTISHTINGKETGIFLSYNSTNKIYNISFLNDTNNHKKEYWGDWKLAKQSYLNHCENFQKHQTPAIDWEEIRRQENALLRNDLHLAIGRSGSHK